MKHLLSLGERGRQSLSFLRDFAVTISLKNHGELTANSRCLNYLQVTACGRNIAHDENYLQHNLTTNTTDIQKREILPQENYLRVSSEESCHSLEDNQTENIMFYTSKKNKEELERYQDCSWFQRKPSKEDFINKLSQAEAVISPGVEVNELELAMQFANKSIPPWGDEYLEVFDEDDFNFDMDDKLGEKENNVYPSNENCTFINNKLGEDIGPDVTLYSNYTLKKTDSYDNMKNISSMNLSDIIPISYQEELNSNYNLQLINNIKHEIKEEPCSEEPNQCIIDSNDSNLNIGREEVIEVETEEVSDEKINKKPVKKDSVESELKQESEKSLEKTIFHNVKPAELQPASSDNFMDIGCEILQELTDVENDSFSKSEKKANLKLDLTKTNSGDAPINVTTPELDFMDLVDYINNEKTSSPAETCGTKYFKNSQDLKMELEESSPNKFASVPTKQSIKDFSLQEEDPVKNLPYHQEEFLKNKRRENFENDSPALSIAERIKIGFTRKRSRRYNMEKLSPYEDDGSTECDAVEADDYECVPKKKKCRSKSNNSDSVISKWEDDERFESDSYRERRDKNNAASRKSRQNKKDKERLMCRNREEAERKNLLLKTRADKLEKLVNFLRQMLLQAVLKQGNEN